MTRGNHVRRRRVGPTGRAGRPWTARSRPSFRRARVTRANPGDDRPIDREENTGRGATSEKTKRGKRGLGLSHAGSASLTCDLRITRGGRGERAGNGKKSGDEIAARDRRDPGMREVSRVGARKDGVALAVALRRCPGVPPLSLSRALLISRASTSTSRLRNAPLAEAREGHATRGSERERERAESGLPLAPRHTSPLDAISSRSRRNARRKKRQSHPGYLATFDVKSGDFTYSRADDGRGGPSPFPPP